jgi:hypothetical protein
MRIEPVYLVSPPARASQPPTRRAFLLAGAAFAGGTLVGGACGYTVGVQLAAPAEKPDIRLKELRRLAVDAPIEELVANYAEWFGWFEDDYQGDPILWLGIDRLAKWSIENPSVVELQLLNILIGLSSSDKRGEQSFVTLNRSKLIALRQNKRK